MKMGEKILMLLPVSPPQDYLASLEKIGPGYEVIVHKISFSEKELPKDISNETWESITVLLTFTLLPEKEQVPNLRYVQILSAGANQLLGKPVFEDTDITFCTANGTHPPQIAEWVFATFLAFQHHVPKYLKLQDEKRWLPPFMGNDTEDAVGLRVGILGYGCIGRQVARIAKALGMDVHAHTLHERSTPESRKDDTFTEPGLGDPEGEFPSKWFHGQDQLNTFLSSNLDLLVITLPGTPATKGLIRKEQFDLLGAKKAFVSNAGRGSIIHSDDLIVALEQGTIRGAALDVTDPEPLPEDHPLWTAPNIIITPHVAGNSTHYLERVLKILKLNLERHARGEKEMNRVDRKLGY